MSFAAVVTSTIRVTVALRIATTIGRTTAITISVFGCVFQARRMLDGSTEQANDLLPFGTNSRSKDQIVVVLVAKSERATTNLTKKDMTKNPYPETMTLKLPNGLSFNMILEIGRAHV